MPDEWESLGTVTTAPKADDWGDLGHEEKWDDLGVSGPAAKRAESVPESQPPYSPVGDRYRTRNEYELNPAWEGVRLSGREGTDHQVPEPPDPDYLRQLAALGLTEKDAAAAQAQHQAALEDFLSSDRMEEWKPSKAWRLRHSRFVEGLVGPGQDVRKAQAGGAPVTPGEVAASLLQMTTAPPPVAEAIRGASEPVIKALPGKATRGITRGVRETLLGFPLAVPGGRAALAAFGAQYVWELPEAKAAYDKALAEGDTEEALQIATQTAAGGGLLALAGAHGAWKGLGEERVFNAGPAAAPGDVDLAARNPTPLRGEPLVTETGRMPVQRAGLAPERAAEVLTPEVKAATVPESPAAETITGSNEGIASEMPAEREERPTPVAPRSRPVQTSERPWDLIDEIEGQVGKIDPALIREADPNWRPRGAARRLFRKGGVPADSALTAIVLRNPKLGVAHDTPIDQFGHAINAAAGGRIGNKARGAAENRSLDREAGRLEQFQKRVLKGEQPKAEAGNVESVPVENLIEGDEFQVQSHKFKVSKLEMDEDGRLVSLTVEDGPKFGVQTIDPDHAELIHIDKGTLKEIPREQWPASEALVPASEGKGSAEAFSLGKPESIEEQQARLEAEQRTATETAARVAEETRQATAQREMLERAAAPLGGDLGSAGQGGLFTEPGQQEIFHTKPAKPAPGAENIKRLFGDPGGGGAFGDPLGAPIPSPAAATPPRGAPGTALMFDARLPVTLGRTAAGSVSIPEVMKSMEGIIQATGAETPIRTGRFHQRARGIYKPFEEVTRLASADNIPTATHETGHALQKQLYGSAYAAGLKGLPPAIKKELVALGRALYGAKKPAAGYTGEGFAEFIRHYLSTDDAAKVAPATEKFFRERVLVDHPQVASAVAASRKLIDTYRTQGSVERARRQLVKRPGLISRVVKNVREFVGAKAQLDEFEPLWQISAGFERRSGSKLPPSHDPFLVASWKRGAAGPAVEWMVNHGMIDPWGNPTGGGSLRQALGPVKGRREDFALYLFGRRAIERWGKGKNPGITIEDAHQLVTLHDSPEFQLAAGNYYKWFDGVLDYVADANPALGPTIAAIRKSSHDYAPLARVIYPLEATAAAAAARANPLYRMHGSGRQVRDIFETTLENASRLVSMAHRSMVLDSIVKLSKHEGMGFLVEEVPRDRAMTEFNFEKIRQQLEEMGVDTSAVDQDAVMSFWGVAENPKGADPIISVKEADGLHWYHVPPGVYELLNGLKTERMHWALDLTLGATARAFRLGTTGLRASFALFTNPTRDLRTFLVQTQSHANPARLAVAYMSSMGEMIRAGLGGKQSPYVEAFYRLGAQLGQPLGIDVRHTKRAAKELFHGRAMRIVTTPIEHLRDLLQITEAGPRVAELKLIAEEVGWTPGTPMTPDQAVQIALAAKRVTVDFSAAGEISKVINQAVPFYNATIQGTRSAFRALRDRPGRTALWALVTFTAPALLNWWSNKDKDWYRELPWRERYLYDNIDDGKGNVWQIPRSPEWGNAFSVVPEAILDSWYRQDPRGAGEALKQILATQNPLDYPVIARVGKEQWQNRIEFFDRPIVPRSQVDLPPGEQRGPYTTKLAQWIGDAFPNTVSPRRIDAAVRAFLGGAVPDLQQSLESAGVKTGLLAPNARVERESELSDLFVIGRLFRRGGEFSAQNLAVGDYYDDLILYTSRKDAQDLAVSQGGAPASPMTAQEYAYAWTLEETRPYFKAAAQLADQTPNQAARQALYRNMAAEARRLLALRPKPGK